MLSVTRNSSTLFVRIILEPALQQRIFDQMEATFPNEGGGFLLGMPQENDTVIVDVIQVANVFESEEQYHRYAMTPQNWMQMEDADEEQTSGAEYLLSGSRGNGRIRVIKYGNTKDVLAGANNAN